MASGPNERARPKVSVVLRTYNHAKFARQAIESVLAQQTNFPFEILVGDDCSTDDTRDVVKVIAEEFPERMRLIFRESNMGWVRNLVSLLQMCEGQYVVTLDGDDYWTDPLKLQIQADYLDVHPECSACFHPARMVFEGGGTDAPTRNRVIRDRYSLEDILGGLIIPTCSYFFRNGLIARFPDWFFTLPIADLPLQILVAQHGLLGFIQEPMGVYRVHQGGLSSGGVKESFWTPQQLRWRVNALLKHYETMDIVLERKYHDIVCDKLSMLNYDMVWSYQQQGDLAMMRRYLLAAGKNGILNSQTPHKFVLKAYLIAYGIFFDAVYRRYHDRGTKAMI